MGEWKKNGRMVWSDLCFRKITHSQMDRGWTKNKTYRKMDTERENKRHQITVYKAVGKQGWTKYTALLLKSKI